MKIIKARKLDAIAQAAKTDAAPLLVVTRISSSGKALQHAIFISEKDADTVAEVLARLGSSAKKVMLEDFEELGGD